MIILNDLYFDTIGTTEINELRRPGQMQDSVTGYLIVTQSRYVRWRFSCTINVNKAQRERLQDLFANHIGPMDFIDWRGFSWLTDTGTNDNYHAYSTGAYFLPGVDLGGPPNQANGYDACNQSWNIPLVIVPNARGLAGNSGSGGSSPQEVDLIHEIPGGSINGINTTFTLAESDNQIVFQPGYIPQTGDSLDAFYNNTVLLLFRNGVEQLLGTQFTWS